MWSGMREHRVDSTGPLSWTRGIDQIEATEWNVMECRYLARLREYDVMLCVGKDSAKDLEGMNYAATCR